MGRLVTPSVYLIGYTTLCPQEMERYLTDTGNLEFADSMLSAKEESGLSDGEILTSFYAKVCYASLTLGKNDNVTRVRDIPSNLMACLSQGHGSVFEHCQLNFIIANCSRVFTHELVRHRVGTAFSQTSGRYVRGSEVNIVFDPILKPVQGQIEKVQDYLEIAYAQMVEDMGLNEMKDFDRKKKITSALRRILPNGQSNEIGFSVNLRALRHLVQMRTSRGAEWEIREVFNQVYKLVFDKYPLLFHGAKKEVIDGLIEVSGLKMQPYDKIDS